MTLYKIPSSKEIWGATREHIAVTLDQLVNDVVPPTDQEFEEASNPVESRG